MTEWQNDPLRVDMADVNRLRIDENDLQENNQLYTPIAPIDHNIAVLLHLSTFLGLLVGMFAAVFGMVVFAFPAILGPIIIWLSTKDKNPWIEPHAKESINFHLSMIIHGIIAFCFCITIIGLIIGIPYLIVLFALQIISPIVAAFKASKGEVYRYPMSFRFLK